MYKLVVKSINDFEFTDFIKTVTDNKWFGKSHVLSGGEVGGGE